MSSPPSIISAWRSLRHDPLSAAVVGLGLSASDALLVLPLVHSKPLSPTLITALCLAAVWLHASSLQRLFTPRRRSLAPRRLPAYLVSATLWALPSTLSATLLSHETLRVGSPVLMLILYLAVTSLLLLPIRVLELLSLRDIWAHQSSAYTAVRAAMRSFANAPLSFCALLLVGDATKLLGLAIVGVGNILFSPLGPHAVSLLANEREKNSRGH